MQENRPFIRKVIYTCVIAGLLLPIAALSMPAGGGPGGKHEAGGILAQSRKDHGLAQSSLGDVDPTSATVNLACLGMRPIAANILWLQAHEYKKREDWTNLKGAVDTIVTLQPHFIAVWDFQGWNLAYNVSVEWDDYRDRYFWVMEGAKFLEQGTGVNREDPTLFFKTGWVLSQKIGKADEHLQFRRLFRDDKIFHGEESDTRGLKRPYRPEDKRDNWLVGKDYYLEAQKIVDAKGKRVKGTEPYMFHADIPRNTMAYAEALEEEGVIDEVARQAWARGGREWAGSQPDAYGQREFETPGGLVRLNDEERFTEQAAKMAKELDAMAPGVRERLVAERRKKLTKEQSDALALDPKKRNSAQSMLALEAQDAMKVSHSEVAKAIEDTTVRTKAVALAEQIEDREVKAHWIGRRRDTINFNYWRARCEAEQTRNALDGRAFLYAAGQAAPKARFEEAEDAYEEGFEHWRLVLVEYQVLLDDDTTAQDLFETVAAYRKVLGHLDEEFPVKGYGLISATEISDWPAFCQWLAADQDKTEARTPAARIWQWWGERAQRPWGAVAQRAVSRVVAGNKLDDQARSDIMYAVNRAIKLRGLYVPEYFTAITLSPAMTEQLDRRAELSRREIRQFNRRLLEQLLPKLIAPARDEFSMQVMIDKHIETARTFGLVPKESAGSTPADTPPSGDEKTGGKGPAAVDEKPAPQQPAKADAAK